MKSKQYQERFYRHWADARRLHRVEVIEKESDLLIFSDKPLEKEKIRILLNGYRAEIEAYSKKNKAFLTSLVPVKVDSDAAAIVKDMAAATRLAGVGPMAAVAGAIADYLAKDLLQDCDELIIENGGDIFLKTLLKRRIGIFAGDSVLSGKLSLEIAPGDTPIGICTSSGTVGHSLNFGATDATVVIARSATVADSFATALSNLIKKKADIPEVMERAKAIKEITGFVVVMQDVFSAWGNVKIVSSSS